MKHRLRLMSYNNFHDMDDTRQRCPSRLDISRYRAADVSKIENCDADVLKKLVPRRDGKQLNGGRDGKEEQVATAAP